MYSSCNFSFFTKAIHIHSSKVTGKSQKITISSWQATDHTPVSHLLCAQQCRDKDGEQFCDVSRSIRHWNLIIIYMILSPSFWGKFFFKFNFFLNCFLVLLYLYVHSVCVYGVHTCVPVCPQYFEQTNRVSLNLVMVLRAI